MSGPKAAQLEEDDAQAAQATTLDLNPPRVVTAAVGSEKLKAVRQGWVPAESSIEYVGGRYFQKMVAYPPT